MRAKRIIIPTLLVIMVFSMMTFLGAAKQKDKPQAKAQERVFIPKEVKAIIQEGLASRQGRQDIPVTIFDSLFLPARENFHVVFFMNITNSALGYAPAATTPAAPAVKKGPQEVAPQEAVEQLQANFNVFLQFNRFDEAGALQLAREVYIPSSIQVPAAGFEPDKEDMYSIGYPMPTGHYLLALAVTSLDLKKVGVSYCEFTLPDSTQFAKEMDTTPIFFVKQMDQMSGVEQRTMFHKGSFTYSVLKIVPNLEKVFNAGENLDIFFYIFGPQPNQSQQYDIEVNFEVKKGEESNVRWSPQAYNSPLISQPLPLKQTVKIKDDKGERTEQRDLPAGKYTLVISILDKATQNKATKNVEFEVK